MLRIRTACLLCVVWFSGCESLELIKNSMIDRWCDDRPCGWEVEGKIKRVGTWHSHDFAVELVSDHATLSQVNRAVNSHDSQCYSFSMIADVESRARAFLELDFLNDGSAEFSQRLPPGAWERRTFLIRTPNWYEGVRFIVRKDGPGRVVVAELRAEPDDECTEQRVELKDRPNGASCERDEQCRGGRCAHGSCSFCRDQSGCASGEICGLVGFRGLLVEQCTEPGKAKLGMPCSSTEQCAASVCCENVCSQCCPGERDCPDGARCAQGIEPDPTSSLRVDWPFQCDPRTGREPSGATCTAEDDCRSGVCAGNSLDCNELGCDDAEADGGVGGGPNCSGCPRWLITPGTCN